LTTYYVAKTGSDSNSCAQAQHEGSPKATIHAAMACASEPVEARRVLVVDATSQTYIEEFYGAEIPGGVSEATRFTLEARASRTATVRPDPGASRAFTLNNAANKYIHIKGLILDCTNCGYEVLRTEGEGYITLEDLEVRNSPVRGLSIAGTGNVVRNNWVH